MTFENVITNFKRLSIICQVEKMLVMVRTSSIFGPYIIFKDGLAVDPIKIEAVVKWESPKSIAEIQSFLDLAGYYRRFVHGFFFLF